MKAHFFRMVDFDCPKSPSASSTSSSDSSGLNTRSVEDLRRKYRKEFVKMGTSGGVCQHCGSVTNKIVHYRSRFIYEGSKSDNFDEKDHFATSVQSKRDRKHAPREKTELNAEELKK